LLKELIKEWNPRVVVIDAHPEIHEVMSLKDSFKQVYSSKFQKDLLTIGLNKEKRIISMDRTCIFDAFKAEIDSGYIVLPVGAEHLLGGNYYSQLKASTRILITDENNPERSYYSWEHSKPDHCHLSEIYCLQADLLSPRDSVLDFYKNFVSEQQRVEQESMREVRNQTGESEEELKKLSQMNATTFLNNLNKTYRGR
jgi:hypothetical protein